MSYRELHFVCPDCGGIHLEEVMVNVTVTSEIDRIWMEESDEPVEPIEIGYTNSLNEGGVVSHFRCPDCGHNPKDENGLLIWRLEDLARWLLNQTKGEES